VIDKRDAFKHDSIISNRFTDAGLADAIKAHSLGGVAKLKTARNTIAKAKDELAAMKAAAVLPQFDTSHHATVLKERVRQHLDRIPPGVERDRALRHLTEKMPLASEAVLELPAELTGISSSVYDDLQRQVLAEKHGDLLLKAAELEMAIEFAESAADAADEELRGELLLSTADWSALTSGVKAEKKVPWLRKQFGLVDVVDMDNRTMKPATEEELREGRYFANYDEFVAANGEPTSRGKVAAA
jgi:hypothetical protein